MIVSYLTSDEKQSEANDSYRNFRILNYSVCHYSLQ